MQRERVGGKGYSDQREIERRVLQREELERKRERGEGYRGRKEVAERGRER